MPLLVRANAAGLPVLCLHDPESGVVPKDAPEVTAEWWAETVARLADGSCRDKSAFVIPLAYPCKDVVSGINRPDGHLLVCPDCLQERLIGSLTRCDECSTEV